jgi:hypothetical protein
MKIRIIHRKPELGWPNLDAKPYVVNNDTYRNQWLGLTVVKPDSFQFTKLDAVWPDDTVVALEGPQRQTIEKRGHYNQVPSSRSRNR